MLQITFLSTATSLAGEFERCCREYESLDLATAWCGDPSHVLPYLHLESFKGSVRATVGRSFNHTHPDAFEFLRKLGADLRVFRDGAELFHPKLYVFSSGKRKAIFVGSSNLTYSGFYCNEEVNALLEGEPSAPEEAQVEGLERQFKSWRSDQRSFVPSAEWIADYRKVFAKTLEREKEAHIRTPREYEDSIPSASWLGKATWEEYWSKLKEGLEQHNRKAADYHKVLAAAAQKLPVPWTLEYFDDLDRRRIMAGIEPYGWLGNVSAAGRFRHLLAKGSQTQRRTITEAINAIAAFNAPIDWTYLRELLEKLCKLGHTMKVWSRLLSLVRPDLYCTIASISVRKNLSEILGVAQASFQNPKGYIDLLKLVHASPWFQSPIPSDKDQAEVWRRRAAFMDGIFYD